MNKLSLIFCTALLLFTQPSFSKTEEVFVLKVFENDDKGIIVRKDGYMYQIEKGTGCLSLWRYEGKPILIDYQAIFLGVGSSLILPNNQQCRIWDSQSLGKLKI